MLLSVMGIRIRCENGSLSISLEDQLLNKFSENIFVRTKKSKTFVFFFKEIQTRIRFHNGSLKTDPCPYLVKRMKINLESSPPEIWIRIRFHNGSRYPSLFIIIIMKFFYISQKISRILVNFYLFMNRFY